MIKRVYICSPTSGVNQVEILDFYSAIYSVCEDSGLQAYVPCLARDTDEPKAYLGEIIEAREHPILSSDLIIAYLGIPSREVGWDLQTAEKEDIPIIILYEDGVEINPLIPGIPTVLYEIIFQDLNDALIQLKIALYHFNIGTSLETYQQKLSD